MFQSILIYYVVVASKFYVTGPIFHILWPYEDLRSFMWQDPYFTSCGLMKTFEVLCDRTHISHLVALWRPSKFYVTGPIFHILWPYEDLRSFMWQDLYFTSCGLMKTVKILMSSCCSLCWYMYFIHNTKAVQHMEPPEMHLNTCCSLSADTSLVEEICSTPLFFMTLAVMITYSVLNVRIIVLYILNWEVYRRKWGDRGGTVVKVLCYKSEGRGFDSRWCHWNFSLT